MKKHIVYGFIFFVLVFGGLGFCYNKIFSLSWASSVGVSFSLTIVASTGNNNNITTGNNNNITTGNNNNTTTGNNSNTTTGKPITVSTGNNSNGNNSNGNNSNGNNSNTTIGKPSKVPTGNNNNTTTGNNNNTTTGNNNNTTTGNNQLSGIVITESHSSANTVIAPGGEDAIITNGKSIQKIDSVQDKVTAVVKKLDQNNSNVSSSVGSNVSKNNQKVIFNFIEMPEEKKSEAVEIIESKFNNVLKPIIKNNIESFPILNKVANTLVHYDIKKVPQIKNITINTGKVSENDNNEREKITQSITTKSVINDLLNSVLIDDNMSFHVFKKPVEKKLYNNKPSKIELIKNEVSSLTTNTVIVLEKAIKSILPFDGRVLSTIRTIFKYFK